MPERHPGRVALVHIAKVLEQRPHKDDEELSLATQCLARFRGELIAHWRAEEASADTRRRLTHLNAVVAMVMGMHFPLGDAPWGEFEKAEAWLKELVAELEPGDAHA